ncbi:transcriptional regulator [bacterium]|nr:transcriptional regulator [bacterium]
MNIASAWRTKKQRYALQGEVCPDCHQAIFPPRDVCPHCTQPAGPVHTMSGRGEIFSFTRMFNVPEGFDSQRPYTVALVKLEEGPMVTAQLTDVDEGQVDIGMKVEMVTRKLREEGTDGQIVYGYKFRPLMTA